MLEAIRNLGILKMIQEFPDEFTYEALESVDIFLEQRKKAIERGNYAKLQFETIKDEYIGVFSIEGENIIFKTVQKIDDTSKYIFRKPPGSRAAYISPTWKGSDKNLKTAIEYFKEYCEKRSSEEIYRVFSKILSIFDNKAIKVINKDQSSSDKNFWSIYQEKKKSNENKKGLNVFTIMIDGKYPGEIKELVDYSLAQIADGFYTTSETFSESGKCSVCHYENDLFPNVLSGVGINIANVNKPGFFPGVLARNAIKSFPICAPCAEALYVAKSHVFPNLIQSISGHQALIIPHLIQSDNKEEGLEIMSDSLKLLRKEVGSAHATEAGIIEDLADNKGIETVSFLFGDVKGQTVGGKKGIRKFLPDVLPSRLSEIAKAMHYVNGIHSEYPENHPWKLKGKNKIPLDGTLQIIKNVLGMAKYVKPPQGKRNPFKASYIDSLDLLEAIFLKKEFPLKLLLPEFSGKLSYDFLGSFSDEKQKPVYTIQDNITQMVYLLTFLDKLEVIKVAANMNFVSKYLEGHKGLIPLNQFLREEAKGLDTSEKLYAFLVGLLFGKLIAFQIRKGVSNNALRWLKGLEIGHHDLMEIFKKTCVKLDDYSFQRPAWSEEMSGVRTAIGALGSTITSWGIGRKEVPYYFCLGQSLSGYYLPSKENEGKPKSTEGGN